VKAELEAAGVKPALERDEVGATFYRRCDVAPETTPNRQAAVKGKSR
jgi:hypothetical protein